MLLPVSMGEHVHLCSSSSCTYCFEACAQQGPFGTEVSDYMKAFMVVEYSKRMMYLVLPVLQFQKAVGSYRQQATA